MILIRRLFISPDHNYFGHHGQAAGENPAVELSEIECVAGHGIRGDRFFDFKEDYKGQITFFEWEIYELLCRECNVNNLSPSVFRRNVITYGVDLNSLIGKKFEIQGVQFEGIEECKPCYWMNQAFHPEAEQRMQGRCGLRARILTSGMLRVVQDQSQMSLTACLVTGGKSSRMGRDKASVDFLGMPLWQHQLRTLERLNATEILISGRKEACYGACGLSIVEDEVKGVGPLSGIISLLSSATQPLVLVLAVDMPYMTSDFIRTLYKQCSQKCGVVPVKDGYYEGLAAIFQRDALPIAREVFASDDRSMQHFVRKCLNQKLVKPFDVSNTDALLFKSLNTPSDIPILK